MLEFVASDYIDIVTVRRSNEWKIAEIMKFGDTWLLATIPEDKELTAEELRQIADKLDELNGINNETSHN